LHEEEMGVRTNSQQKSSMAAYARPDNIRTPREEGGDKFKRTKLRNKSASFLTRVVRGREQAQRGGGDMISPSFQIN